MNTFTRTIPAGSLARLNRKVARLNRRAERLGADPLVLEWSSETRWVRIDDLTAVEVLDVRLTGEVPRLRGYRLVATVDHGEAGNIIARVPTAEDDLSAYRTAEASCAHCSVQRRRIRTAILADADGNLAMIGRSCLKDFLGPDAEAILAYAGFESTFDDDEFDLAAYAETAVALADFLDAAASARRLYGWTSKARAAENGGTPTAYDAWRIVTDPRFAEDFGREWNRVLGTEANPARDEAETAAVNALRYAESLDVETAENDFEANLAVIAARGVVTYQTIGYAAAFLVAAEKAAEHAEAAAQRAQDPVPTVPAPEGAATVVGTIRSAQWRETDFGSTLKALVVLDDGNRIWTTVPAAIRNEYAFENLPGLRIAFSATFQRADGDDHFSFATRPSKARVLTDQEVEG